MKFSLVIPVAPNRGAEIIESIKKLNYPRSEFHVVVVHGTNPSMNRNKGAARSKGEFIAFLDDDAVLDPDYLKEAEEFFEKNKDIDMVGGPQLTPHDDAYFAKTSGHALSSKFGAWKLSNRYTSNKEILNVDETALTSANLICRRKVMDRVQFDHNLFPGEDPKFVSDSKKAGFKVAYSPKMILYHRRRSTVGALIKQIFNYGKVRPAKESIFETLKMPFFFIPSLFFLYLLFLVAALLGDFLPNLNKLILLPLGAYIFLDLVFSIYDSAKNKDYKAFFFLPFTYPIIHLSYGAGMIWGYFKKI